MKLIIIGAGLSGVLAANYFRRFDPVIYEAGAGDLLGEHHSIMRIGNEKIMMILGCGFKEVYLQKAIYYNGSLYNLATVQMENEYSLKVCGGLEERSISDVCGDKYKRYLVDFSDARKGCNIKFGTTLTGFLGSNSAIIGDEQVEYDYCISTIPITFMKKFVDCSELTGFNAFDINIIRCRFPFHSVVNQTIYFPDSSTNCYRATIEGDELIIEWIGSEFYGMTFVREAFGISRAELYYFRNYSQKNGKITYISPSIRKTVMMRLTRQFNVFSFGRYAIWKSVKADSLINDLAKIEGMISADSVDREYKIKLGDM